jgi:alanine or glycine:cation symporter, AGCS family
MWGMWEFFIDTLVMCTMTALVVLVTDALPTGLTGAALASEAFTRGLSGFSGNMVLLGSTLFSYTTMLSWCFYGDA